MHMRMRVAALAGALVVAGMVPAMAQVTAENFRTGRTGDLAALCGAGAQDPNHMAASAYCQGFLIAAGQYHQSATGPGREQPIFCLPTPNPTLDQAIASFVTWAAANPQYAGDRAVDGVMRFAAATYPCPAAPRQAHR